MNLFEKLSNQAKSDVKTIVLPESSDIRTIEAASKLSTQGYANIILIGNETDIKTLGKDFDLSSLTIIDHVNSDKFEKYAEAFFELRKAKGISMDQAREAIKDDLYFSAMMVKLGDADGMVAGAIHSTADTLRPALQIVKTAPGIKFASTSFLLEIPNTSYGADGIFVFSDSALAENPNSEELSEIAIASAKTFHSFVGEVPKVALLSYSTYGSANSESTRKVVAATKLVKEKAPDLLVDGELQLDAAIVPSVGEFKAPGSSIAGHANVLIFPDLNAGNIGYKLVQRFAKAITYGPITQGLAKPINDLSRGCNSDDIVRTVILTAIQAQNI
jgi:phosphate acetyltransferase